METRFSKAPDFGLPANSLADERVASIARDGWRELGFWCGCDVAAREWTLRGDRLGLAAFARAIREFLAAPESMELGGHVHLGPFSNLRLIRASEPKVTWRGISGTREHFEALAQQVELFARSGEFGAREIGGELFAPGDFALRVVFEQDGFDPASAETGV